jgi:hypothetical protein
MVKSSWSQALFSAFGAVGFQGQKLQDFCDAIAGGSASYLTGLTFTTMDVGATAGSGSGVGTGITGVSADQVAQAIYSAASSAFGGGGAKLMPCCEVIGSVLVSQLAQASLQSTHSLVYLGTAQITPGSIAVSGSAWGSAIQSAAPGFNGKLWPAFAQAIGTGCASGFSQATGSLVISGSGSQPPIPGMGSGSGISGIIA